MTTGYTMPSAMTVTTVKSTEVATCRSVFSRAGSCEVAIALLRSRQMECDQDEVDQLDPDERHDDPAEAVDEHVLAQHGVRAARAVRNAAQGERNERDDDERVE